MANKVLSIYVGNDAIRIAEMQNTGKTVILTNAAEVSTPANSVNDGYIIDVTAVAEAIRASIFGRGFSSKDVIFTVTSKKIASKEVDLPYIKNEKQLESILKANSGEYFPMTNTGDYAFASTILDNYTDEEGKKTKISAVAAPYDLLRCYYELASELRFNVKKIDYFGNSIIQLLSVQMMPGRTDLVLQIEKDQTYVNVMRGKVLVMQRSVPYGKNAVINALMDVKKISEKDAKTLLSNETLIEQHVTAEEYAEAVSGLVSGIGRAVEYHRTKNPSDLLQGIKVFGEGSAIAGIEAILKRELGAEVQHFESLQGVTVRGQASLTAEEVLRYLPNIGAVIKPMDLRVDNSAAKVGPDSAAIIQFLKVAFIIACVAVVCWIGLTIFQNVQAKQKRDKLNADIAAIQDIEDIRNAWELARHELNAVKEFEYATHSDNEYLLTFINDLEVYMPTDSFINDIDAEEGDVTFTVVTGFHPSVKNEVADVMINIANLPYVTDFKIEQVDEKIVYYIVKGINDEGKYEFLMEKDEDGIERPYEFDINSEEDIKKYGDEFILEHFQATYEVSCHIGDPNGVKYDKDTDSYYIIDENGVRIDTDVTGEVAGDNPLEIGGEEENNDSAEEGGIE